MHFSQQDTHWMRRALRLAAKGFAPPNPMVGCVLVKAGKSVGEGYYPYSGQPHAEVFALRAAGELARGATAYVTLEPHSYHSRTPPCTDALIKAGVARVVVAILDNNPRVSGQGMVQLKQAGIETEIGLLAKEAEKQNEAFLHFHAKKSPFITLKAAMTLDGKIATQTGDSKWITGTKARSYVHLLRAQSGAVMVGIGTALKDDPQLTARLSKPLPRQPLRIVVDGNLRLPPTSQLVQLAEAAPDFQPLLIATTETAPKSNEALLARAGVEVLRLPSDQNGRVDLCALCALLTQRQIISLFVEGGGQLHASLLQNGLAQKVLFFIAPKLVGGHDAPTPLEGEGFQTMAEALELHSLRVRHFSPDIMIEGYLPNGK